MPGHNGPPDVAEPLDIGTEPIKRPKKRGTGTRRPASRQQLRLPETAPPDHPASTPDFPPPEPLNPPALFVPLGASNIYPPADSTPSAPSTPNFHGNPASTANLSPASLPASSDISSPPVPSAPSPSASREASNPPGPGAESSPPGGVILVGGIAFHHASEAEFARLLNYYGIEWLYEPNQFPLQWRDGRPVEMFSPDFYLVEYDLYIELTTMRQSLVRRKNHKLRLLRALYPEINIKLLYRRDYQRLLERFGIKPEEIEAEVPPPAGQSFMEEE